MTYMCVCLYIYTNYTVLLGPGKRSMSCVLLSINCNNTRDLHPQGSLHLQRCPRTQSVIHLLYTWLLRNRALIFGKKKEFIIRSTTPNPVFITRFLFTLVYKRDGTVPIVYSKYLDLQWDPLIQQPSFPHI